MTTTAANTAATAPPVPSLPDDAARWAAVERRDRAADGAFVYAVATTGVYCRPSCPARRARRGNVSFHPTPAAAEAAGFRPCRRCRPEGAGPAERQAASVAAACRQIERAVADGDAVPLAGLAAAAGLSRFRFHRLFKAVTGVTPKEYAAACRAGLARRELDGDGSVTGAIYGAGYNSPSRFYETATARLGMTPSAYRDGGRGADDPLRGRRVLARRVLVAATDQGVCAILLGDDPDGAGARAAGPLPEGAARRRRRGVRGPGRQGRRPRRGAGAGLDLPLDVRGTAFQQRVWQALRAIPAGTTASYAEIAAGDRRAEGGARRGPGLRREPARGRDPLPPGGADRRRALRLPLGRRAQARAAAAGGGVMAATLAPPAATLEAQVADLDWAGIAADLDAHGCAVTGPLLAPAECAALAALYDRDEAFRSRVVMARHGFGRGEYKYFAYPLPEPVATLRARALPARSRRSPTAGTSALGSAVRYPAEHADFLARCHAAGQTRPTPLLLRYGAGDYNCLHQDLYGEHVFPLQVAILLSEPGRDFTGGEFVLTEQRPRMQSRAEVVPLRQGEACVFAVSHRPVQGTRGTYRVNLRHGVSRLRSGMRHTLGIIFHDAA